MSHEPSADWTIELIKAALEADGNHLSDEQIAAIRRFVAQIGGLENARLAVQMLSQTERAA